MSQPINNVLVVGGGGDFVVVVADVVVFVNVFVLALLVATDHILFTCGQ